MRGDGGARVAAAGALVAAAALGVLGCGGDEEGPAPYGPEKTEILTPDAPPLPGESECRVVKVTGIEVPDALHLKQCKGITYATNPPAGGDHWGTWAAFKKYAMPVPREVYVHDMEHGAVVLSFRCADACPEVMAALEKVYDDAQADPLCVSQGTGVKARLLLTPDPDLTTPIAASAWGATYTATCIDTASLAAFVAEAYGRGPEQICVNGVDLEAPGATPLCP